MNSATARPEISVLAVDDEPLILDLLVESLRELGFQPVAASDGTRAVQVLAEGNAVDLLITDLQMPGMDGVELARKAREQRPNIPVLFISGYSPQFHGSEFNLGRGTSLLTKPFTHERLARAIKRALE
ncbi:response regulator [Schauerella aestuarii]|uniref:response regulator n=1 Tax=Schauerella aestuarii TaxID=2511204 RepID=UPI00136CB4C6|nr:response regulator [Achromobacter aestuarii]MYZ46000.1 response regulator [Achromobacter aestuarii]